MVQVLKRVENVLIGNPFAGCESGKLGFKYLELLLRCEREEQRVFLLTDDVDTGRGLSDLFGLNLVGQGDLDETPLVIATDICLRVLPCRLQAFAKHRAVPSGIVGRRSTGETTPRPALDDRFFPPQLQMRPAVLHFGHWKGSARPCSMPSRVLAALRRFQVFHS